MYLLLLLLNVQFCNQKINLDEKVIICNKKIAVKEFEKLKNFKKLEILDLSDSNFNDIKHIETLKELRCLSLKNTKIKDLKGIGKLNNLIELDISKNNLMNHNELKKLTKMEIIQLDIFNEKILNHLLKLKKLFLIQTFYPISKEYLELRKINEYNFFVRGRKKRCVEKIVLFYLSKLDGKFDISLISFIKDIEEFKRIILNICNKKYKIHHINI